MKKITTILLLLFSCLVAQSQSWIEYQLNSRHGASRHTIDALVIGTPNSKGFSTNVFALVEAGAWGEILALPSWSKEGKLGFFSFSLGGGLETATVRPRLAGSVFWQKGRFESLLFWEQGTNRPDNSWHLAYITYKFPLGQRVYSSVGLHSQRGSVHGMRGELGHENKWKIWAVLGVHQFAPQSLSALVGLRYFL